MSLGPTDFYDNSYLKDKVSSETILAVSVNRYQMFPDKETVITIIRRLILPLPSILVINGVPCLFFV